MFPSDRSTTSSNESSHQPFIISCRPFVSSCLQRFADRGIRCECQTQYTDCSTFPVVQIKTVQISLNLYIYLKGFVCVAKLRTMDISESRRVITGVSCSL